jgi:hypothetical protein
VVPSILDTYPTDTLIPCLMRLYTIVPFRNATVYNPPENMVHQAALRLSTNFLTLVEEFKAKQIQAAQKSFARSSAKPNSAVAALIEEENRKRVLDSLVPSSGTLIVVPGVLMEHWQVG